MQLKAKRDWNPGGRAELLPLNSRSTQSWVRHPRNGPRVHGAGPWGAQGDPIPYPELMRGPGETLKWGQARARDLSSQVSPQTGACTAQAPLGTDCHKARMEDGVAGQQGGPSPPGLCPHPCTW